MAKGGAIMPETGLSILASWGSFYGIIGAASATLTGLMFISMTLIAGVRARAAESRAAVRAFSTPIVVHFCAALLVAAIMSAPWQALWNVGVALGLEGLGGVAYCFLVVVRVRHQHEYDTTHSDWVWYLTLPLVAYVGLCAAALALPGGPAPALFAIAAVTVLLLFIGLRNAWDSVTYIVIERAHPEEEEQ
jgi:hypothetical protein